MVALIGQHVATGCGSGSVLLIAGQSTGGGSKQMAVGLAAAAAAAAGSATAVVELVPSAMRGAGGLVGAIADLRDTASSVEKGGCRVHVAVIDLTSFHGHDLLLDGLRLVEVGDTSPNQTFSSVYLVAFAPSSFHLDRQHHSRWCGAAVLRRSYAVAIRNSKSKVTHRRVLALPPDKPSINLLCLPCHPMNRASIFCAGLATR
jgi:hypothetical protein